MRSVDVTPKRVKNGVNHARKNLSTGETTLQPSRSAVLLSPQVSILMVADGLNWEVLTKEGIWRGDRQ